ncbi:S8 family serine peptidase [Aquimarina sp. 2201CG1-2-11]|uniref:S8 family serine peptidase n=1 Tax=Aquimarina discodermiae TaxID=3231043 RepID=UPI003462648B
MQKESYEKSQIQRKEAFDAAKKNGWKIKIKSSNGGYSELQRLGPNKEPIYFTTLNTDAAKSTRTNYLHSGGALGLNLNGQNMIAHVWDAGHARITHQEYDGPGATNRVSIEDANTETGGIQLNDHAAHVSGIIAASGVNPSAKGMAPQARVKGYKWTDDIAEVAAEAANGMLISNHSYSLAGSRIPDQWFGAYIEESKKWDEIMFNAPFYLMVVGAGNDGQITTYNAQPLDGNSSYDQLKGKALVKNNLVVANALDATIDNDGSLNSVSIWKGSSRGPSDEYRIKPDIAGNGAILLSTGETSDDNYIYMSGTSMASPNVAGTLLLLQQHYNNLNGNFMKAATLKGLALHTADDMETPGPDAATGWGLLNGKFAAETITNKDNSSKIEELTLNNNQNYIITVDSDGTSPLLASISWTDRPGTVVTALNSKNSILVNDLDLRITKGNTTYQPHKLTSITTNGTGDNNVDPFERIDVINASGTYTITVTHKGTLTGGSQKFSLIVTGVTNNTSICTATVPTGITPSGVNTSSANIIWDNVSEATYDLRYRQTGTSNWTTISVNNTSSTITGLTAATVYEAQVRSKCSDGSTSNYSNSINFTTTTTQLNYCSAQGNDASEEYIGRVQLGSINNSSVVGNGYTDHTSISTSLSKGVSNTITVTPTWTGSTFNEAYGAWIDYNQNGDFEDAGEQVWTQSRTQNASVSGSFTVPNTATNGATRMRVIMRYNTAPSPCGSFNFGEVEDYTVTIQAGGTGTNDICEGIAAWSSSQTYQTGDKVTYQGNLYERTATGWTNLGACGTNSRNSLFATQSEKQLPEENRLIIHPNPVTNGYLNIQTNTLEIKRYTIINTLGQTIQQGTFTIQINLKNLESGIYTLQTKNHSKRFIIQ